MKDLARVVDARPLATDRTLELARWMARMYLCSLGEALATVLPGGRREGEIEELSLDEDARDYPLAEQQLAAVHAVTAASSGSFYLHGVTGSGKTDVYLAAARDVTAKGRGVIYLVPEISLTHQVVRAFTAAFGERLAVLHSSLTPSQRLREWLRVLDGRGRRGDRRAQRRVRTVRPARPGGDRRGAGGRLQVLLGSPLPRPAGGDVAGRARGRGGADGQRHALARGLAPHARRDHRSARHGRARERRPHAVGRGSRHAPGDRAAVGPAARGDRAHPADGTADDPVPQPARLRLRLPLPQLRVRGHLPALLGEPDVPPRSGPAGLPLLRVLHGARARSARSAARSTWDGRGSAPRASRRRWRPPSPSSWCARVDTDSVRERPALRAALEDFRAGRVHVLLGTQMVAKGLDFPGVRLVGIVNADTGAWMPDFRAAERTFSLLVQVSGRAGRSVPDGIVLIQTLRPDAARPSRWRARDGWRSSTPASWTPDATSASRRSPGSSGWCCGAGDREAVTKAADATGRAARRRAGGRGRAARPGRVPDRAHLGQLAQPPHRPVPRVRRRRTRRPPGPSRPGGSPPACTSRWTSIPCRCCSLLGTIFQPC